MTYFNTKKKHGWYVKLSVCTITFLIILIFMANAISSLSEQTLLKGQETLSNAIASSTVQFYALEGFYPENIEQLIDQFNIEYDRTKYFIDYQVQGTNIYPDITVICR